MTLCLYSARPIREPKPGQRFLPGNRAKYHRVLSQFGPIMAHVMETPGAAQRLAQWWEAEQARTGRDGAQAGVNGEEAE